MHCTSTYSPIQNVTKYVSNVHRLDRKNQNDEINLGIKMLILYCAITTQRQLSLNQEHVSRSLRTTQITLFL